MLLSNLIKDRAFQMWGFILLGLLALYIPTYKYVADNLWALSDQAHGPIVLSIVIYLLWQKKDYIFENKLKQQPNHMLGWPMLLIGLFAYIIGRSQDIMMLDLGSQIPILASIFLLSRGTETLKKVWFPLFFILFLLPFPLASITMPMKMAVSYVTESILYWLEYPIARQGVVLHIGQYQLLVADACAGMHTLISLEALGLLYLNLVQHDSAVRNILLAILIIPISFTSNVIRVIALTLITYYFGDEVGQGFVHGFAGMFLFVIALILIMSADTFIQYIATKKKKNET